MKNKKIYLSIVLISISLFLITNFSSFTNHYAIADDEQQTIYWMYQFQDSNLFNNDPLTDYASFFHSQGIAFVAIYYILIKMIGDPILIFKILSLLFVAVSAIFIFKIGEALKNKRLGMILTGLFLVFLPVMSVTNGFYKNFASVLFLIFLYFYISKKFIYSLIITSLITLFYAPITLICLTILAISLVDIKNRPTFLIKNKKKIKWFIAFAILCLFIVSSTTLLRDKSQFGSLITAQEMKEMPEFYNGGRAPVLPTSLSFAYLQNLMPFLLPEMSLFRWDFLKNPLDYWVYYLYALCRMIVIFGASILFFKKFKMKTFLMKKEIWHLFFSGLILYFVAKMLLFYMYVPKRYIGYTLPLFLIIFVATKFDEFLDTLKEKAKIRRYIILFILFFLIFNFPPMVHSLSSSLNSTDCEKKTQLFDSLSTLPKDTMIAGHPYDMDCIPIFTKRKVYLNFELSAPFYSKYYDLIKDRTYKLFYVYYTSEEKIFNNFCKLEKVDYFVFNKEKFSNEYLSNKEFYIKPFNNFIIKLLEKEKDFYFKKIPKKRVFFENNQFLVVKC
jgi:hypothetical protein